MRGVTLRRRCEDVSMVGEMGRGDIQFDSDDACVGDMLIL